MRAVNHKHPVPYKLKGWREGPTDQASIAKAKVVLKVPGEVGGQLKLPVQWAVPFDP